MGLPFASVIIPTLNRPAALSRCLESLSGLAYPRDRFEVVVVDDGGDAPLDPVTAIYQPRLTLRLLRQPNGGPASARNAGAAIASGELLAFTDDDCLPDPGWLAALAARAAERPGHLIGGRTINALTDNPYAAASQAIVDVVYKHYNPDPDRAQFFASNNMAMPAAPFRELGGFDASFRVSEDRELCDRWLASGRGMAYAPAAVVRHAHDLTAVTFWRQHFGYGRGASRFHRQRRRRHSAARWDMSFHTDLRNWRHPFVQVSPRRAAALAALLALWQVANAAGFFYETARSAVGGVRER